MGSTGDADRKRRHCSSISASPASAKKQPSMPLSEDKKLDAAVLQFQNQKLVEKLEAQKLEINCLADKICKLKEKQLPYDNTLSTARKSLDELVDRLDSKGATALQTDAVSLEDAFLHRLLVTGATESSSNSNTGDEQLEDSGRIKSILHKIVAAVNSHSLLKDKLYTAGVSIAQSEDRLHLPGTSCDLYSEVKNLRPEISSLLEKHLSLSRELQSHMDMEAKNKSELKHLQEEFENSVMELEESNRNLAIIRVEKDSLTGASFPILGASSNRPLIGDKGREKNKEVQELESVLKELQNQSSCRLLELKLLNEERVSILKKLCALQNTLKNFKGICSSEAYRLLKDQLAKAKADLVLYQALYEKLQVERDILSWKEKETNLKNELIDVYNPSSSSIRSKINDLEKDIQRHVKAKNSLEAKLEKASKEPSRNEIIDKFKTLASSLCAMQSQLKRYKDSASDIHTLRADVESISHMIEHKTKELQTLSATSTEHAAEIENLNAVVRDLKQTKSEFNLILQMFRRESYSSREVLEAREAECKAWAEVQSLTNALDERNLELRVKKAIEDEAAAQQRLAATDAVIAELRQKRDASRRECSSLKQVLQSKNEEIGAYSSEIETIGKAYVDMQAQNHQLLLQIAEGDEYNTKLVLEGVQTRQQDEGLLMEKQRIERSIQLANAAADIHSSKVTRIEDLLKTCSTQVQKLSENRAKSSSVVENNQRRLIDVTESSHRATETLEKMQSKVDGNRMELAEIQIQLEKERFERKREEEELALLKAKIASKKKEKDESSATHKLRQELKEYKEILKCSICLDRRKEVVIGKCYHLFCNPCVQKIIEKRRSKCPICQSSFGPNDVKAVYI